jgi:helicase SWR1
LDILESFLNFHGYRYLRLDGATKVEQRQALTEKFNRDLRISAFILSTRSGGLGINLTGADTVLFYDLDWNAAIEAQCMDRAHRIGQTRDVHIYRFVTEHTIEENMLRKANQKRLLDSVVIQEGEFNTEAMAKRIDWRDMLDEGGRLGDVEVAATVTEGNAEGNGRDVEKAFLEVEDEEDREAALAARQEMFVDASDFAEPATPRVAHDSSGDTNTPVPADPAVATPQGPPADEEDGSIDDYMLEFVRWDWDHFA